MTTGVELRVSDGSEEVLVYAFKTAAEAGEMIHFLSEFFPNGRFLVQPMRH